MKVHLPARLMLLGVAATLASGAQASPGSQIADAVKIGAAVQAVGADSFAGLKVDFPGGVTGYPDTVYATLPGYRPLKLDLFLPPKSFTGPRPLIVYVHGGGWMGGGPRRSAAYQDWPAVLATMAARGYVVASVAYRFSGEAPSPAAIQDVKSAIRWLRANAGQYGIDPKRAAIWGQSAGGQLAALAGTSCGVAALEPGGRTEPKNGNVETVASTAAGADAASDCVQAVVSWFGIYDFVALRAAPGPQGAASVADRFIGCGKDDCTALAQAASPITYVDKSDPPMLLMHGEADRTVPVAQTRLFDAALRKAGVPVRTIIIPGVDHSWIGTTPEATAQASRQALGEAIDFIDARIGDARTK
jgi:acetyl esterase/lipase